MLLNVNDWVQSRTGSRVNPQGRARNFDKARIGLIESIETDMAQVWFIGQDERWKLPVADLEVIDVIQSGDEFAEKICNTCHRFFPVGKFAKNQTGKGDRIIRRPACRRCRTDIDKRPPRSLQAKKIAKQKPEKGSFFQCPVCNRWSITDVTAKVVADHNHHTGNIRDFICGRVVTPAWAA